MDRLNLVYLWPSVTQWASSNPAPENWQHLPANPAT
jgi:hypothetical protein